MLRVYNFLLLIVICSGIMCQDIKRPKPVTSKRTRANRILDSSFIINNLAFLSSDTCGGRAPGTSGHLEAEKRIIKIFREMKMDSINNNYADPLEAGEFTRSVNGTNYIGIIKGKVRSDKFVVLSAHYDHLGKHKDKTFYGADDNASGVACVLAIAKYFQQHPPDCSLIIALFDFEENGLLGAFDFVNKLPAYIKNGKVLLNINLDMVARSDKNEIYACGSKQFPFLIPYIEKERTKTKVDLLLGHDSGSPNEDWTYQSDHFAFYKKGIPFLYLGVEDHKDYHKASDTFDKINLGSYIENCNMIASLTNSLQQGLK